MPRLNRLSRGLSQLLILKPGDFPLHVGDGDLVKGMVWRRGRIPVGVFSETLITPLTSGRVQRQGLELAHRVSQADPAVLQVLQQRAEPDPSVSSHGAPTRR
jgi:hypothetical protein